MLAWCARAAPPRHWRARVLSGSTERGLTHRDGWCEPATSSRSRSTAACASSRCSALSSGAARRKAPRCCTRICNEGVGSAQEWARTPSCVPLTHAIGARLQKGTVSSAQMTYIVNDNCIKCKYMDCVEVCPVDCFYEGENMLVIHPDECIDCGVCEPECPVEA